MADLADVERDDPTFVEDLRRSAAAVWRVAQWLHARGNNVTIRPLRVREDIRQMSDYADTGDLEIIQRVEVKHRDLDFNDKESFRAKFATMIVDVAHTWDQARPKPYAYVVVNRAETVAAIVMGHTFPRWQRVKRWDKKKNREREFYVCPVDEILFVPLTDEAPQ